MTDSTDTDPDARRLRELAFLNEIAQLATLARDWDELMHSIVDGTTAAMGVEVCSFYLADHERIAADPGRDQRARPHAGRSGAAWTGGRASPVGSRRAAPRSRSRTSRPTTGSRGSAASTSRPCAGCCRCRSNGTTRSSASSTSRPATGAASTSVEVAFLQTIAALLAGIVEKGRLTAEVEGRLAELTALDAARAELLSVVTHELRTPLSVVRVYVDLLAEAADRPGARSGRSPSGATPRRTSSAGSTARSIRSSPRSVARA